MAAKKTQKKIKCGYLISPVGKALWVSAPNPSEYDPTKTEATIILSPEDSDVFKAQLKELCSEAAESLGVDIDEAIENYLKPNTDADGNMTGEYRVKAKTGIQYPPTFVDAKGKTFTPKAGFSVPNGSQIRLSIGFEIQVVKPSFKGIVARLRGIQIINLRQFDSGFDAVTEGDFDASAYTPSATPSAPAASDESWGDDASGWE